MSPLTDDEARNAISDLSGWKLVGGELVKQYVFGGFPAAIAFVNRIAERAEAADHHPDLEINYNRVRVRLRTHSADGITDRDTALAREIEGVSEVAP